VNSTFTGRLLAVSLAGAVGRCEPAAAPALHFELRIDGRPVDPVQWLRR
jgi:septal ring factor EnvC (AmiA/AmiB activator)